MVRALGVGHAGDWQAGAVWGAGVYAALHPAQACTPCAGAAQQDVVDLTLSTERRTPPRDPDPGPKPQEPAPCVDTSPDAVLRRCEQISADLRSKVGSHESDRCAAS